MDSDSDFYGDEETVSKLEARVADFDPTQVHSIKQESSSLIIPNILLKRSSSPSPSPSKQPRLHNRFADKPGCWRVNHETLDEFLLRLPPSTTQPVGSNADSWIWAANPYLSPGSSPSPDLPSFREGGRARLALLSAFNTHCKSTPGKPRLAIRRELDRARDDAVGDLRALAVRCNVVAGKWMLFVDSSSAEVDSVWEAVARATANNELGIGAKVEPCSLAVIKERLVVVYTRDFRDIDDIGRVLEKLRELGLVRFNSGKQIYYKSDAWTELGIYGNNEWGIKASMYSSDEMFQYIRSKR
ncbi:hypothetical protein QBC46DRAFT_394011 [Diplogelasinospora grovesii]|uniref:DUF1917-domain-containing protein n=1 Tax=Diplogelasinospora grovesii TaxID=303347 RepID=A0AAN6N3V3_9PEZI|nr:hypothetical protein QBC46DRAFT_394011 [Diplogelasinospora grovesii]